MSIIDITEVFSSADIFLYFNMNILRLFRPAKSLIIIEYQTEGELP